MFGYGTNGLTVTGVSAFNDGDYGISRFVSTHTVFTSDIAVGDDKAGFYVGDSPLADTVVRGDIAEGNQFGIFIRHARHVSVSHNLVTKNCRESWCWTMGSQAVRAMQSLRITPLSGTTSSAGSTATRR